MSQESAPLRPPESLEPPPKPPANFDGSGDIEHRPANGQTDNSGSNAETPPPSSGG